MLKLVIWLMLGTVIAGVAVLVVVSDPHLYSQGMKMIPLAAVAGFLVALPISFIVSKRL
ncbi:MAG: hypothetical protein ACLPPF_15130 [Rhodomicrobium sp.]